MEHKNAASVTDEELYNGFVWLQKDGKAVSMYYGKKIVWSVVTGVEEVDKWHIYTQLSYAMLAATYNPRDLKGMAIDPVRLLVEPDGDTKPFLIDAVYDDVQHAIIEKLRILRERGSDGRTHDNG